MTPGPSGPGGPRGADKIIPVSDRDDEAKAGLSYDDIDKPSYIQDEPEEPDAETKRLREVFDKYADRIVGITLSGPNSVSGGGNGREFLDWLEGIAEVNVEKRETLSEKSLEEKLSEVSSRWPLITSGVNESSMLDLEDINPTGWGMQVRYLYEQTMSSGIRAYNRFSRKITGGYIVLDIEDIEVAGEYLEKSSQAIDVGRLEKNASYSDGSIQEVRSSIELYRQEERAMFEVEQQIDQGEVESIKEKAEDPMDALTQINELIKKNLDMPRLQITDPHMQELFGGSQIAGLSRFVSVPIVEARVRTGYEPEETSPAACTEVTIMPKGPELYDMASSIKSAYCDFVEKVLERAGLERGADMSAILMDSEQNKKYLEKYYEAEWEYKDEAIKLAEDIIEFLEKEKAWYGSLAGKTE